MVTSKPDFRKTNVRERNTRKWEALRASSMFSSIVVTFALGTKVGLTVCQLEMMPLCSGHNQPIYSLKETPFWLESNLNSYILTNSVHYTQKFCIIVIPLVCISVIKCVPKRVIVSLNFDSLVILWMWKTCCYLSLLLPVVYCN